MNSLRAVLRPWRRHPWQSLFQWLSLATALGLTGLLIQILVYGHLTLPPGITPHPAYYSLGARDARGGMSPLSLLQAQTLLDELGPNLGQHTLYAETDMQLAIGDNPERHYRIALMSNDFHDLLGLTPSIGRFFSKEENRAAQEALIDFKLWQSLGRPPLEDLRIRLNKQQEWRVVGVLPRGFSGFGNQEVELWLPDQLLPEGLLRFNLTAEMPPEVKELTLRFAKRIPFFHILGRLRTPAQRDLLRQRLADLDLSMPPLTTAHGPVITGGISLTHSAILAPGLQLTPELWRKTKHYTSLLRLVALTLMTSTLISLVVFLMQQLPERLPEYRLRHIFGADIRSLAGQLFGEHLVFLLSTLPPAWGLSRLLFLPLAHTAPFEHFIPDRLPPPGPALLTWGLIAALILAGLLTLPILWAIGRRLLPGTTAATADRKENRLLLTLNTTQTLVAILALVLTALFILNLVRDSGYGGRQNSHVQLLTMGCKKIGKTCDPSTLLFLDENDLLSRLNAPPDRAGLGESLFNPLLGQKDLLLEPLLKTTSGAGRINLAAAHVSRGWLQAMEVPLIAGRWPELEGEVLVNQAFLLNQGMSAAQAIGSQYRRNGSRHLRYAITGVLTNLPLEHPRKPPLPRMFFTQPSRISTMPRNELAWRDPPDPDRLKTRLRQVLDELGLEELGIKQETLTQRIEKHLRGERNFAALLIWSTAFTLLLAITGLYASTRYALNRQRKRLGILLAHGARPWQAAAFLVQERGLVLAVAVLMALFFLGLLQPLLNPWLLSARASLPTLLSASLGGIVLAGILAMSLALGRLWRSQPVELIQDHD